MLTEIQAEYIQRLQKEAYNVFEQTAIYFDSIRRLDVVKATLENVLTEAQSQELNSQWRRLDLVNGSQSENDLMVVLMAKSKTINNQSDFRAFRYYFSTVIKAVIINQSNIRFNETVLENLRDKVKSAGANQLENTLEEIEQVRIHFPAFLLYPLLKLEDSILEGEDVFGFERAPFPEEYKAPIRKNLSKIDDARSKLSNASFRVTYVLEFDVSSKSYDKDFRIAHENYVQELLNLGKSFLVVSSHSLMAMTLGNELIEGKFGLGEYQNFLNGGDFTISKPHTQCLEILGNYKKVVEKEKARLESIREEGDTSILNELGQLYLLSRGVESVMQEISSAKEENAEAYHNLTQLVNDVQKNSKYY